MYDPIDGQDREPGYIKGSGDEIKKEVTEDVTEIRYDESPRHEHGSLGAHEVWRHEDTYGREKMMHMRRGLSWGAIFAGLFVAIGTHLLLGLLGMAIGLSSWVPGGSSAGGIATSVGLWALVSALIALFLGGATTGHLAGRMSSGDGFLHGAVLWSLATVATVWLIGSGMGFLLGGAFNVVGHATNAIATVASSDAAAEVAPRIIAATEIDREPMVSATGRARQAVREGEIEIRARRTGSRMAEQTARGAWWTLLALGLSLGAAGLGASTTAKREMKSAMMHEGEGSDPYSQNFRDLKHRKMDGGKRL
jgi:hypothetical protein